jgi:quercetin dioxygenase-like cupin family protein
MEKRPMERFNLKAKAEFQAEKMAKVDLVGSPHMMSGLNCFEPGQSQKVHAHGGADKLYYVVEGKGEFEVGESKQQVSQGELLYVPADLPHGVVNTSDARLIVLIVISPNPFA